jgi:Rad3-related DNA helicase
MNRDIPSLIQKITDAGYEFPFRYAKLKGKHNYLCTHHIFRDFFCTEIEPGYAFLLLRLLFSLLRYEFERDTFVFLHEDRLRIQQYVAYDNFILTDENPYQFLEPYFHAKNEQKQAHICVVNHSLALAMYPKEDQGIYKHVQAIVFDEAHKLEDAATDATHTTIQYE